MQNFKICNTSCFLKHLKMLFQVGLVTFVLFHSRVISPVGAMTESVEEHFCYVELDSARLEKLEKAVDHCVKQKGPLNYTNYPPINASLEEFNHDDNCFNQCFYKEINMLTEAGKINPEADLSLEKSNMTKEMKSAATKSWKSCIDDTEKVTKAKGITDPCKLTSLHDFCFNKKLVEDGSFKNC